jgi:GAF domain-containing protein
MTNVSAARLAEVLVEVADTLVDEFDLIEFLQMVTTHTSELVGAEAAGILLADHRGRLQLMASTDERTKMLELFQIQAEEGPCQDCFRGGAIVAAADPSALDRWPRFAHRASAAGFRSVHAFPLRLRGQVIGALNLFSGGTGRMAEPDVRIVQALADIATIGLLQERAIRQGELLTEQLQGALNSRVSIEQAKGALAQIHGISPDEAFELMRTYSRSQRRHLSDVAALVTGDPSGVPGLTGRVESP